MASILYFRLVQDTDPLFASMVSYLIPLVAVCFGIWDGESFQVLQGLALILIISGVYLSRQ
jgi:drug/metabolite transporter (DMT)-like permease